MDFIVGIMFGVSITLTVIYMLYSVYDLCKAKGLEEYKEKE